MKKILLLLLFPVSLFGQGLYVPAKTILGTVNGYTRPIAGATITVCAASTGGIPCAPALANTVFQDSGLTVPLSNPLFADSSGNYPQFAVAPGTYTITESAAGYAGFSYQVQTSCVPGGACSLGSLTVVGTATVGALVATGNISAATLGVTGLASLPNANVNGIINAGNFATFALALAACPNPGTLLISSAITVSANASVPSTCSLKFLKPGVLNIATATTVTINSVVIAPDDATIFSLTGTGAVAGLTFTRPEWFGGTTSAAVLAAYNSCGTNGCRIQLRDLGAATEYDFSWSGTHATEITKTEIEIAGSGMAEYNSQTAPTGYTGGGTVITGPVWVKADPAGPANGFKIHDLSVDNINGVTGADGIFINNNFPSGSTNGPPFVESVRVSNVRTLGHLASSAFHSFLCDNCDGAVFENTESIFNIYGLVMKGQRYRSSRHYGRGHNSACIYAKSDTLFGSSIDISISHAKCEKLAVAGDGAGLVVDSQLTANNIGLRVDDFAARGTAFCMSFAGINDFVQDVSVSNFICDSTTATAIALGGAVGVNRITFANGIVNNSTGDGIQIQNANVSNVLIDNVIVSNNTTNGITNASGVNVSINNVKAISNGLFGVQSTGSAAISNLTGTGNASGLLATTGLVAGTYGPKFMTGLMTGYNNIATVSNGIPSELATVDSTGLTAAVGTTTLYAVPSTGAGQYRLSWDAKVTTAAGVSSTLGPMTITYTDPDGTAISQVVSATPNGGVPQTGGATNNNTVTILVGLPLTINAKASTNIQYAFAYASNAANAMAYNLHLKLEAL